MKRTMTASDSSSPDRIERNQNIQIAMSGKLPFSYIQSASQPSSLGITQKAKIMNVFNQFASNSTTNTQTVKHGDLTIQDLMNG